MAKGVLYVMTTVVGGLIKIGKTTRDSFNSRMYTLERNGYANVPGLKRQFAIEVEDCDEKEELLDNIFNKSQVPGTELFAMDLNIVIQLLSSFEGEIIYPKAENKEAAFDKATDKVKRESEPGDKRSRFRFSDVEIPVGAELRFVADNSVKVTVADDTHISYKGEIWSMSKLTQKLLNRNSPVQGTMYFSYNGKRLTDLREEMENR